MGSVVNDGLTVYFALPSLRGLFAQRAQWPPGGAEVQMASLARGLAAVEGVEVVLVFDSPIPDIREPGIHVAGPWDPVHKRVPILSRVVQQHRASRSLPRLSSRGVLLQSQVESQLLARYARRSGIKLAYRVNGDSLVDGSALRAGETLTEVQQIIRNADLVITQSDHQRALAQVNLGVDSVVIPSGVTIGPAPSIPGPGHHVLWIGRCDPIKRPWVFVELAKRCPDHTFVMVMTPGHRLLFDEIATEAEMAPNLTLLESRARDELLALYEDSSLVVSTSISEGMPNVLIEAGLAGRPFLSYAVDPAGLLADGSIGICAGNDFEVLHAQLLKLLSDASARARIGHAARAHAETAWALDVAVGGYVDAFVGLFA